MASAKDTFEANTFEANTFACGTWRGLGVAVVAAAVSDRHELFGSDDRNLTLLGSDDQNFELIGSDDRNLTLTGA
jgi:hypothetical protein